jgi:hypothetical protein
MLKYNPLHYLPTAEELPDSDDTLVDNHRSVSIQMLEDKKAIVVGCDRLKSICFPLNPPVNLQIALDNGLAAIQVHQRVDVLALIAVRLQSASEFLLLTLRLIHQE